MARRCIAQGIKNNKQLQFTLVMQTNDEAGYVPDGQADLKGKEVATS